MPTEEMPYQRLVGADVVAEEHRGNPLDNQNNRRTEFGEEGQLRSCLLTVQFRGEEAAGSGL